MSIVLSSILRKGEVGGVALAGLTLPREIEIQVTGDPAADLDLLIRAVITAENGYRYTASEVVVTQREDGPGVSNLTLRTLQMQRYLRTGLESLFEISPLDVRPEEAARIRGLGPSSSEALVALSRVYSFANAVNLPPAKTVQEAFGMPAPTASAWIRRARDLRFIPSPKPLPSPGEADG